MVFSDISTNQGIVQETDFLANSDSSSYPIDQKTRNINQWNSKVVGWIFSAANPRFQYDDTNYTTLPFATTDLVSGQSEYRLDASWLDISRVDMQDANGRWIELKPIDESDIYQTAYDTYQSVAGTPQEYDLISDVMILKPTPNYSQTAGLKVFFERSGNSFSPSDTTSSPGFAPQFHRVLSLGAAFDFALAKQLNQTNSLRQEIQVVKDEIYEFYGSRNKSEKTQLKTRRESFR
ncbi:MAG: hypothetical protein ACR2N3_04710 [Pyrinomonadaceae bacterium]